MKYFVPAWHDQYVNWSLNIPTIENYDASDYMGVLKKANEEIGLIITDYQPQLVSKINQVSYTPDKLFSVFDYIQGIHGFESKVVELSDFNWPDNITNIYNDFNSLIYLSDKPYAVVSYDIDGHILKIDYLAEDDQIAYSLLMDSRGFVSSKEDEKIIVYYDPFENWRLKKDKSTGKVYLNPEFKISEKTEYSSISELIDEIVIDYLKNKVQANDQLIVTVDDNATFNQNVLIKYSPIYSVNQMHPYTKTLKDIGNGDLVVNSENIKKEIEKEYGNNFRCSIIPVFNSEFRLGHSQRQTVQEIGFFAENADNEDIKSIIQRLSNYLAERPTKVSLKIYTYDFWKNEEINNILKQIEFENKDRFIIGKHEEAENKIIDNLDVVKNLPQIDITNIRLTSLSDIFSNLDSARILLNWGKGDLLMQISGISVGIPQIQNFPSYTVANGRNSQIISNIEQIVPEINKYLTNLDVWNQSLVYNVQFMDQFSDEKIVQKWDQIFSERKKSKLIDEGFATWKK